METPLPLPVLPPQRAVAVDEGPYLRPEGRVLATLEQDGRRRWLRPKPSNGRWHRLRLAVAVGLILVYTLVPWTKVGGMPTVLLDLVERKFVFFGTVFRPTETLLFGLLFLSVFVTVFLLTAILGRVWCGWACPQTVYMEFVYRPLERLFLGKGALNAKAPVAAWRRVAMYAAYLVVSAHLANTLLAWFVGADRLTSWIFTTTPFRHPAAFAVFAATTLLMLFDFAFFREQMCALVCPYGRFQSALLDQDSLIVAYDRRRGEPRARKGSARGGAAKTKTGPCSCDRAGGCGSGGGCDGHGGGHGAAEVATIVAPARQGDCIDCTLCVQTCPAGIDIRDGLQLECIQCTQCIDACDAVMTKLGKPTGLIRYSSQRAIEGAPRKRFRARLVVYPLLLAVLLTGFTVLVLRRETAYVAILRTQGVPYAMKPAADGAEEVESIVRLRVDNRTRGTRVYRVTGAEGVRLVRDGMVEVAADASGEVDVFVRSAARDFVRGRREIGLRVEELPVQEPPVREPPREGLPGAEAASAGGAARFDRRVKVGVLGPLVVRPVGGAG